MYDKQVIVHLGPGSIRLTARCKFCYAILSDTLHIQFKVFFYHHQSIHSCVMVCHIFYIYIYDKQVILDLGTGSIRLILLANCITLKPL